MGKHTGEGQEYSHSRIPTERRGNDGRRASGWCLSNTVSHKGHPRCWNEGAKVWWKMGYLPSVEGSPYEIRLNHKGKNSHFTMEKPGCRHLSHLQIGAQRTQHHFCGFPAPNVWPGFNREQIADKHRSRDLLQSDWPLLFESVEVTKSRSAGDLLQVERDKGGVTAQCNMWSWTGPWSGERTLRGHSVRSEYRLQINPESHVSADSLVLIIVLGFWELITI